jgi:hypothetical protein
VKYRLVKMAEKLAASSTKEETNDVDRPWSDLPYELLCLVSSHLLAGDFVTFRAVCKSWRSSTSLIQRKVPLSIDSPHFLYPCLMSVDYHKCRFYHPTYLGDDLADISELLGAHICFSKYGWLLLTQNDRSIFFFNPFTKVKVELPPICSPHKVLSMCFSSPPISSDCFVLVICMEDEFGIIKRGEKNWTFRDISVGRLFGASTCKPILYRGMCYCLENIEANVGVFDPNGDDPCHMTIYTLQSPLSRWVLEFSVHQNYLVESDDGKLFAVFMVDDHDTSIYVFEVNFSNLSERKGLKPRTMVWHRVTSLGNRMMYLSPGGSFLEPAIATGTSNKIYLPMIRDNKNVFYSFDTAMYHSFTGGYSSKNSYNVQELQTCCWIKSMPELTFNRNFEWCEIELEGQ